MRIRSRLELIASWEPAYRGCARISSTTSSKARTRSRPSLDMVAT